MRKLARFISTASIVTLGLAAVPFAASADAPRPAESSEGDAADHMHGGAKLFEEALEEVQLRPEQKAAIDDLKADAKNRHASAKMIKGQLALQIADQIEQGKIDRCTLGPTIRALASAKAQARPGDRAAFERLHAILDPGQRATFVDALKNEVESVMKEHEPAPLADNIAKSLNLSSEQRANIEKILDGLRAIRQAQPWYAAHREMWTKILDAFKTDHFVLDEIAPMKNPEAHTAAKVEQMLWAGEAILPVLTPEQCKAIADKIRARVNEERPGMGMEPSPEE
jgi:Spy/CpxP family protein refolding chaperone